MKPINNHTPFEAVVIPSIGPDQQAIATLIVKGSFAYSKADIFDHKVQVASEQTPINYGDEPFPEKKNGCIQFESDIAPFKPKADIVLVGCAHSPRHQLIQSLDVRLKVGKIKKQLRVFGDRKWNVYNGFLREEPTPPVPFHKMELTYDRSFGGIDMDGGGYCPYNLIGKGYAKQKSKREVKGFCLPNIEDPKKLIETRKCTPRPVGFGYYGKAWKPRLDYLGTYDESWQKQLAPLAPKDFRFEFYNAAHPDLQVDGYLKGTEVVEMIHLAPESKISFNLPGIQIQSKLVKSTDSNKQIQNLEMNLDTLCLLPEENRFFLIWRGYATTRDLACSDIDNFEIF